MTPYNVCRKKGEDHSCRPSGPRWHYRGISHSRRLAVWAFLPWLPWGTPRVTSCRTHPSASAYTGRFESAGRARCWCDRWARGWPCELDWPVRRIQRHAIAVVGSRKASRLGLSVAASISEGLVERGFAVISGMAYGIDSAAHRGALASGGPTAAVMGCGLDQLYPPGNRSLAAAIAGSGVILSEFLMGVEPYRSNFPQRNRVISGL